MNNKSKYSEEQIKYKQWLLENARQVLKEEFVGIDNVIDKVIDSLNTWFLFPELQDRPVVINLWGMTGVGKTALVIRLSNLLEYDKKLFRYDMGNNSKENTSLKELLKNAFRYNNGTPYMIMLDEFQYAKTKSEDGCEVDNHFSRVVWDLLDSGKFQANKNIDHEIETLASLISTLEESLKEGVTVQDGVVTSNQDNFSEIISHPHDDLDANWEVNSHRIFKDGRRENSFLPELYFRTLHRLLNEKQSMLQFKKMVYQLDGPQTIELLKKTLISAQSNKWIDCSKSVVFILGNLDEAYTMSSSFNPDISANEFHESSKNININHIKLALKCRFRYEQISRLGNNHIIYPAFNEESFYKLIDLELSKISNKIYEQFGFNLSFSDAFKNLLYREGVFPTQGTRPLFSTIYQLVNAKIPNLIAKDLLNNKSSDSIHFHYESDHVNYTFLKDGEVVYEVDDFIELTMEKLREPSKDDLQAITAVHEAGHAVVSLKAFKVLPEYICSTSADVNSLGFMVRKSKWKYLAKDEIIPRIAEYLGGIVAEKIIFGEDKVTRGAEMDIAEATELAIKAVKDYGMGSLSVHITKAAMNSRYSYQDFKGDYNEEIRTLIQEAYVFAENLLLSEKVLLLKTSDCLSDERMLNKEHLKDLVRKYGSNELRNVKFIEEETDLYYRNKLKSQVVEIRDEKINLKEMGDMVITLNKHE